VFFELELFKCPPLPKQLVIHSPGSAHPIYSLPEGHPPTEMSTDHCPVCQSWADQAALSTAQGDQSDTHSNRHSTIFHQVRFITILIIIYCETISTIPAFIALRGMI